MVPADLEMPIAAGLLPGCYKQGTEGKSGPWQWLSNGSLITAEMDTSIRTPNTLLTDSIASCIWDSQSLDWKGPLGCFALETTNAQRWSASHDSKRTSASWWSPGVAIQLFDVLEFSCRCQCKSGKTEWMSLHSLLSSDDSSLLFINGNFFGLERLRLSFWLWLHKVQNLQNCSANTACARLYGTWGWINQWFSWCCS